MRLACQEKKIISTLCLKKRGSTTIVRYMPFRRAQWPALRKGGYCGGLFTVFMINIKKFKSIFPEMSNFGSPPA